MFRALLAAILLPVTAAIAGEQADKSGVMYKNPQCSCCEEYASYLREHGYEVTVKPTHDLASIKKQLGVSEDFEGCHTMVIGEYVVEGHVPVKTMDKLLSERPDIKGISLPGMPQGSPGMTGVKSEPFTIYEIPKEAAKSEPKVYVVE